MEQNPWVEQIQEALKKGSVGFLKFFKVAFFFGLKIQKKKIILLGPLALMEYLRSDAYKYIYGKHVAGSTPIPPKSKNKEKKISRHQNKSGC